MSERRNTCVAQMSRQEPDDDHWQDPQPQQTSAPAAPKASEAPETPAAEPERYDFEQHGPHPVYERTGVGLAPLYDASKAKAYGSPPARTPRSPERRFTLPRSAFPHPLGHAGFTPKGAPTSKARGGEPTSPWNLLESESPGSSSTTPTLTAARGTPAWPAAEQQADPAQSSTAQGQADPAESTTAEGQAAPEGSPTPELLPARTPELYPTLDQGAAAKEEQVADEEATAAKEEPLASQEEPKEEPAEEAPEDAEDAQVASYLQDAQENALAGQRVAELQLVGFFFLLFFCVFLFCFFFVSC